jgi:molecular chaperone DnaK
MKAEAEANAEADASKKAEIDKLNQADSMIFQTEKQLKEFGDKLPEDVKSEIESLKDELIKAKEAKDLDLIDELTKKMNQVLSNASQASSDKPDSQNTSDEVEAEDVEFEEVN